jgi:hypothetical protein
MEIVGAFVYEINYRSPELYVLINGDAPGLDGFAFEQRGQMFVAERDGIVRFYYEDEDDGTGYGFLTLPMRDGTQRPLRRAWSSRAGVVNRYYPERHVIDVTVGEREDQRCKGGWRSGYALTVEKAREVLEEHMPGWDLGLHRCTGEPVYLPYPHWSGAVPAAPCAKPLIRNTF